MLRPEATRTHIQMQDAYVAFPELCKPSEDQVSGHRHTSTTDNVKRVGKELARQGGPKTTLAIVGGTLTTRTTVKLEKPTGADSQTQGSPYPSETC